MNRLNLHGPLPVFLLAVLLGASQARGSCQASDSEPSDPVYDVVVYGGTSAGAIAAVQASRMGHRVILIEPSQHVGGLTSGGLGMTDSGNTSAIGGISREFYQRLRRYYEQPQAWKWEKKADYRYLRPQEDAIWRFEPSVAEKTYRQMLGEAKVSLALGERLDLQDGVRKQQGKLDSLRMESGRVFRGRMFIDATYEGDLMARAGVRYAVGREANSQFGETLNGVQTRNARSHQFNRPVDPYLEPGNPSSGLLPGVQAGGPGREGEADQRVQAYCFRVCMTDVPENQTPFPKPDDYDPLRYELLLRYLTPGWNDIFGNHKMMPNRKSDTNNHGGFGSDNIGMNYDFPDGDYATREKIIREHESYQKGLYWFLTHDPRVPAAVRDRVGRWGLAKDEFVDNHNWPHQIYIREARRMVSDHVQSELDCRRLRETPEPVGMGSYNMDSHNVQRYVDAHGHVRNEGDVQVNPGGPYQISYRAIRPREEECQNLLVPVCLSSSHIAYGSIRMEPVFMILGQSAATAAAIAIHDGCSVQKVDYQKLRTQLLADGQVLDLPRGRASQGSSLDAKTLEGLVLDDDQATRQGDWLPSSSIGPFVGDGYLHDSDQNKGRCAVSFQTKLPKSGQYEVRLSYSPHDNRAVEVPVVVEHAGGASTKKINQRQKPKLNGAFVSLGIFRFEENKAAVVTISNEGTTGHVIVDAVQFLPAKSLTDQ